MNNPLSGTDPSGYTSHQSSGAGNTEQENLSEITVDQVKSIDAAADGSITVHTNDGTKEIDLGIPKVAGNDIVFSRMADGWEIQYLLKFGSLSGNGGKKHIWKYEAKDDGTIKFLEEEGEPIPSWMRCSKDEGPLAFGRD